ncbi:common pilus major fimbrillin subunit EcpA [Proteus sp. ZN5]|uniref:common pilus major fimbrillin subunit EcpA n=1 Tax=Proteus sp. ZN5 TaxID=2697019 RepID=UPI0013E1EAA2|nr:common pilus major fimbrillin subunit EcpA [Proteus sp. ZN5]QIG04849.1 fimbrial protein [Proteus sp. ZN5]
MKKYHALLSLLMTAFTATAAFANTSSIQTVASWQATAVKKPQSELGVTPLNALHFEVTENNRFNEQNGTFDITVKDIEGATDFKLTSKVISNELRNAADNSVLTVKTDWNGKTLSSHQETVILDNQKGINKGLVVETKATEKSELKNLQSAFLFNVINGTQPTASLPEGLWEGALRIEFTSKWSGDFVTLAAR